MSDHLNLRLRRALDDLEMLGFRAVTLTATRSTLDELIRGYEAGLGVDLSPLRDPEGDVYFRNIRIVQRNEL